MPRDGLFRVLPVRRTGILSSIYIRNVVPGSNPAARFMLSFHEYAELEACGPLFGKIFSIATR